MSLIVENHELVSGLGRETYQAGHEISSALWTLRAAWETGRQLQCCGQQGHLQKAGSHQPLAPCRAGTVCSRGLACEMSWESFLMHVTSSQKPRTGPPSAGACAQLICASLLNVPCPRSVNRAIINSQDARQPDSARRQEISPNYYIHIVSNAHMIHAPRP